MVIDAPSYYNVIIVCVLFNHLGVALSILYLCMKYLLFDGRVGVIQGDQKFSRKCYVESLKLKRVGTLGMNTRKAGSGINLPGEACKDDEAPPQARKEIED